MRDLKIEYRETNELTNDVIQRINDIKNQHWKHTNQEHMEWFKENIRNDDVHLLMYGEGSDLLAYMNMVFVKVLVNKISYRLMGIGNVCVNADWKGFGIGTVLMSICNAYIKEKQTCGLILCREDLIMFYKRVGWEYIEPHEITINGMRFDYKIMKYDPFNIMASSINSIWIDRYF